MLRYSLRFKTRKMSHLCLRSLIYRGSGAEIGLQVCLSPESTLYLAHFLCRVMSFRMFNKYLFIYSLLKHTLFVHCFCAWALY